MLPAAASGAQYVSQPLRESPKQLRIVPRPFLRQCTPECPGGVEWISTLASLRPGILTAARPYSEEACGTIMKGLRKRERIEEEGCAVRQPTSSAASEAARIAHEPESFPCIAAGRRSRGPARRHALEVTERSGRAPALDQIQAIPLRIRMKSGSSRATYRKQRPQHLLPKQIHCATCLIDRCFLLRPQPVSRRRGRLDALAHSARLPQASAAYAMHKFRGKASGKSPLPDQPA